MKETTTKASKMNSATHFARAIVCTTVLLFAIVGCGEHGERLSLETADPFNASGTLDAPDTLDMIDQRTAAIETKYSHSEISSVNEINIPSDKPEDVPIFPDAEPTIIFGSEIKTIRLECSVSSKEVQEFYVSELRRLDWRLINESPGNIQGRKSPDRIINVDLIEDGDTLVVSVQYN